MSGDPHTTNPHAAANVEPMHRPDHKAKRHPRPNNGKPRRDYRPSKKWTGFPGPREGEQIGGGYFVFKRGDRTGRIENRGIPFEHGSLSAAVREAERLRGIYGGKFDVFSAQAEVVRLDADNDDGSNDDWDFDPRSVGAGQ